MQDRLKRVEKVDRASSGPEPNPFPVVAFVKTVAFSKTPQEIRFLSVSIDSSREVLCSEAGLKFTAFLLDLFEDASLLSLSSYFQYKNVPSVYSRI